MCMMWKVKVYYCDIIFNTIAANKTDLNIFMP